MIDTFASRFCWLITRIVVCSLMPIFLPMRVVGKEHLPREGAAIFAANHVSMLDPVYVSKALLPRQINWFSKSELFDKNGVLKRLLSWYLKNMQAIPIRRGTSDMGAIKEVLSRLKEGGIFAIFPEGTRNRSGDGKLGEFNTGIGLIALMSRQQVYPVYIHAPKGIGIFKKVTLIFDKPVELDDLMMKAPNSERTKEATRRIEEKIKELSQKNMYN